MFSPYASSDNFNLSMTVFFSFTRNLMLTHCSVFIKHDRGHYFSVTELGLAHDWEKVQ
jgi:hypothetical protein